jgi:hypothetical protein
MALDASLLTIEADADATRAGDGTVSTTDGAGLDEE